MVCLQNFASSTRLFIVFASVVFFSAAATPINIGGLFPLTFDQGSGNEELAAAMLAISQINNKTDGIADNILTDFQVYPQNTKHPHHFPYQLVVFASLAATINRFN